MGSRGIVLPLALLLCVALGFVMVGAATMSLTASRIARNFDAYQRALHAAEAGLERGVELLALAHEAGIALPDSLTLVAGDSLGRLVYQVSAQVRREPAGRDLNGNGVANEVVRYDRSWGYMRASAAGGAADPGAPVRIVTSLARGPGSSEELVYEVGFERDPAIPDPRARGAWRAVPLRWSSLLDRR